MSSTLSPITEPLDHENGLGAEYDRQVREDIELFRRESEEFMAGRLTADQFRGVRLRRGIYGQRQPDVHMVRTKVPGGRLTADQMVRLAEIAEEFGGGRGHLTTRQNVQYHFVPLPRVPDLLHKLADVRLTTREACYNTVRNVSACPLAGLIEGEPFDVTPYAQQVAFAFLHQQLTDNLPRKFKFAFSACPDDCMAVAIHDVGLRAVVREEGGERRRGFRMVVGGGLGPLPNEAVLLDDFVPVERLVNRCEAVLRVFAKYGNRQNKNKARLKFVLRERGLDWLREAIDKEYRDILENGGIRVPTAVPEGFGGFRAEPPPPANGELLPVLNGNGRPDPEYSRWLATNITPQKQSGYVVVTVRVEQGNFTAAQMHGLARLAREAGDDLLRFTINQNVSLAWIERKRLPQVYAVLRELGLESAGAGEIADPITCPGSYSCNLGLTKTMNLGAALTEAVRAYDDPQVRRLTIKASGCPNSCGHHWTGDFGFYGNARKINGREIPYYQMLLGGGYEQDGAMRFGLAVQSVPARLAPVAVRRVLDHFIANRLAGETFRQYVLRFKIELFRELTSDLAKPPELFPEIYQDWGDDFNFSLSLGRGECAS